MNIDLNYATVNGIINPKLIKKEDAVSIVLENSIRNAERGNSQILPDNLCDIIFDVMSRRNVYVTPLPNINVFDDNNNHTRNIISQTTNLGEVDYLTTEIDVLTHTYHKRRLLMEKIKPYTIKRNGVDNYYHKRGGEFSCDVFEYYIYLFGSVLVYNDGLDPEKKLFYRGSYVIKEF